jgi:hypothetical protein
MRISEKRSVCAITDVSRIRLARPFKSLFFFLTFNSVIPISSFLIMLAARFPLSIPFKHCMQLLRRGRRLIRKGGDIKYRVGKDNTVPDVFSRLIRLKHDSNSLSEDKDILEDVINKYYCYNATVRSKYPTNLKIISRKNTMMRVNGRKFISVFVFTAVR